MPNVYDLSGIGKTYLIKLNGIRNFAKIVYTAKTVDNIVRVGVLINLSYIKWFDRNIFESLIL